MKILVIAERLPSQLGGGSARQYNIIRALHHAHQYTVATHAFPQDLVYRDQLSNLVERLEIIEIELPKAEQRSTAYWRFTAWQHAFLNLTPQRGRFFQTKALRKVIANLLVSEQFDLVQVHQAYLMPLLPKALWNGHSRPVLLDMHDILSDFERQAISTKVKTSHRIQTWLEWQKMKALERKALRQVNLCLAVSEEDRSLWQKIYPGCPVQVAPNGVDLEYFHPSEEDGPVSQKGKQERILFCGSLNYGPNAEAVRWFHREIFPYILTAYPNVSLQVVGWGPPADIQAFNQPPTIEVTGFVEDIRPYLAGSWVVIVPLLSGSGTRLKILDAWAMGKAVVATHLGAQGLKAEHNRNILLANDPQELANCVLSLLGNPSERRRLGVAGRKTVEEYYSWQRTGQVFESAYHTLAG